MLLHVAALIVEPLLVTCAVCILPDMNEKGELPVSPWARVKVTAEATRRRIAVVKDTGFLFMLSW
jgi:hypothetical protein